MNRVLGRALWGMTVGWAGLTASGCGPQCDVSGTACVWAGTSGEVGFNGDGLDRRASLFYWTMDLAFAEDGTPWFIDWNNHLIRRVTRQGTVETVVGWTDPVFPGDGAPDEASPAGALGTSVQLNHPTDLAFRPDGTLLFMAWHNHKLRSIDAEGRVRILAGGGAGFAGDQGPMGQALFKQPSALQLDPEGNAYILDQQNQRIRKIDPMGTITTIAGSGQKGYRGDGGPALQAQFHFEEGSNPEPNGGLAFASGKLYISDTQNHRIRELDLATQQLRTIAGTGEAGDGGDGGPATAAQLNQPRDLEFGPDGHLYLADTNNSRIRAIDLSTGLIRTVMGTGELGLDAEDGRLATLTTLRRPFGLAFDAQGAMYVCDTINSRILRVTP